MELVRTNKYKLKPNAIQKAMLFEHFSNTRFVYNKVLGNIKEAKYGTYIVKNGKNKGKEVNRIPSQTEIVNEASNLKQYYPFLYKTGNDFLQASLSNLYTGVKKLL